MLRLSVGRCKLRLRASSCLSTTAATGQSNQLRRSDPIAPVPLEDGATRLPFYSQYPLERHVEWRGDDAKLDQLFAREDAVLLLISKDKCVVERAAAGSETAGAAVSRKLVMARPASVALSSLYLQPQQGSSAGDQLPPTTRRQHSTIFLGLDAHQAPYFAHDIVDAKVAAAAVQWISSECSTATHDTSKKGGSAVILQTPLAEVEWQSARALALSPEEGALVATAVGVAQWSRAACFSSSSGEALEPCNGGFARRSPGSKRSVWPRVDPAVIMLTTTGRDDEWCLLGRKPEWPQGRYSTLAGFVEVGEPLEMAVAREVQEESLVPVDLSSIAYVASQPWPFPRSLMIGFYCKAKEYQSSGGTRRGYDLLTTDGRRAAIDVGVTEAEVEQYLLPLLPPTKPQEGEMADTRWFHRDFITAAVSSSLDNSNSQPSPYPVYRLGSAALQGAQGFQIPGMYSLAHRLILGWMAGIRGGPAAGPSNPSASGANSNEWLGDQIPQVHLDVGVFKYVLMRLSDSEGRSKLLVWGDTRAGYHMNVFETAKTKASRLGLMLEPLGGGRMQYTPPRGSCSTDLGGIMPASHTGGDAVPRVPRWEAADESTAAKNSDASSAADSSGAETAGGSRCLIYGYSSAFGAAPHELSAAIVRRWYPFSDVAISYEGY